MELNQKISKMSAQDMIGMYVAIGREIESFKSELDSKEGDAGFIDLPDNELVDYKERVQFLTIKIEQLSKRQEALKQSALEKLQHEASTSLPSIEKELGEIEDKRNSLEKKALAHSVAAEEIDCYIRLHPTKIYRNLTPEMRNFAEDQRIKVKKDMGLQHPSLIEHRQALKLKKQLAETKTDYTPEFEKLVSQMQ